MTFSKECKGEEVPGDEAGSWQFSEGVDHVDHECDYHNTGVYDVQLGSEVHFEPKKWEEGKLTIAWNKQKWPDHATYCSLPEAYHCHREFNINYKLMYSLHHIIIFAMEQHDTCHKFPA